MLRLADGGVRYLTVREAARVQGFADSYHFPRHQSRSANFRQLGNAVPPPLAERFSEALLLACRAGADAS